MKHLKKRGEQAALEKARADLNFFKSDTLSATNEERKHLGLPEVTGFIYAIEGIGDCYKSEAIILEAFNAGFDEAHIQQLLNNSGSTCVVKSDEKIVIEYLSRCYRYGNDDISLYPMNRPTDALLYVTWTNGPC